MRISVSLKDGHVLVRCGSHRARERLFRELDYRPQGFYSWRTEATGGFYEIKVEHLEIARTIKGVTKASDRFEYMKCWSTKD